MGIKDTWQTTPAPDVASVTRELTFGTRPSKKPSFSTRGAVLAPVFCKAKKDYIDHDAVKNYKTKVVENGSSSCFVFQKLTRVPKVSSRVTLATVGTSVVCQIYIRNNNNI